jgi:hypothetical protein
LSKDLKYPIPKKRSPLMVKKLKRIAVTCILPFIFQPNLFAEDEKNATTKQDIKQSAPAEEKIESKPKKDDVLEENFLS